MKKFVMINPGRHDKWIIPIEVFPKFLEILSQMQEVKLQDYKDEKGVWRSRIVLEDKNTWTTYGFQFLTTEEFEVIKAYSKLERSDE